MNWHKFLCIILLPDYPLLISIFNFSKKNISKYVTKQKKCISIV